MKGSIMKKAVTRDFRELCMDKYPALRTNEYFRRVFRYIAFSSFYDEDTDLLIISKDAIHKQCFQDIVQHGRNFSLIQTLSEMKVKMLPNLTWSDYEYDYGTGEGKARRLVCNGFDDEMTSALELELRTLNDKADYYGLIDFVSGKTYLQTRKIDVSVREDYVKQISKQSINPTQKKIIDSMNGVNPTTILKRVNKYKNQMFDIIDTYPPHKAAIQRRIIHSIYEQPETYYAPSLAEKSCRLHPHQDSPVSLKKELRKILCQGWTDADLRSSQFCILATVLNAPVALAFIESGKSIWQSLYFATHGIVGDPPPEIKKIFKVSLYGLAYGMAVEDTYHREKVDGKYKTVHKVGLSGVLKKAGLEKFLTHSVIEELISLRKTWFEKIKKDQYAVDVWGVRHVVTPDRNHRSVAACVIQSYEMEIISAVFDVQEMYRGAYHFEIKLFQHDGFTLSFQDKGDQAHVMKLLSKAVEDKAKLLGVTTTLEFEGL